MLKVIDILPIGNSLSVALDGSIDKISNGCKLVVNNGIIDQCNFSVGSTLSIAQ